MSEQADKATFLAKLIHGREEWEALLARVPADLMTVPGASGEWSVKDVIAHVEVYERWTADQIEGAMRGETEMISDPADPPEVEAMTMDQRNDLFYQRSRERTLEDIVAQERASYERLLSDLQALPAEMFASTSFAWTGGQPLSDAMVGNTFGHYEEHTPWLEAFLLQPEQA